jgi:hypothetical protein
MIRLHDRAGRRGRSELLALCRTADDCVIARDKGAHNQIKHAVEIRARMLQLAKMRHFRQLVSRLQSMITEELVAPSAEVFVEDDLPEPKEDDRVGEALKRQYDRFLDVTILRIGVNAKSEAPRIRVSFPNECESVRTSWSALCDEHDPRRTANFPARYFVPFLKRTLRNFRNRYRPEVWRSLMEQSIVELIDSFKQATLGRKDVYEIARRIRAFIADDACYSAHVDLEHKRGVDAGAEFFYAPVFDKDRWSEVKALWGGLGVRDQPSRLLLGRSPHFAMVFAQAQVGFEVEDGQLVPRVADAGKEAEDA